MITSHSISEYCFLLLFLHIFDCLIKVLSFISSIEPIGAKEKKITWSFVSAVSKCHTSIQSEKIYIQLRRYVLLSSCQTGKVDINFMSNIRNDDSACQWHQDRICANTGNKERRLTRLDIMTASIEWSDLHIEHFLQIEIKTTFFLFRFCKNDSLLAWWCPHSRKRWHVLWCKGSSRSKQESDGGGDELHDIAGFDW